MPVKLLTTTQRKKLSRFPSEIPREDLISHFSLCEKDMALIRTLKGEANKMGFALQVSGLRYLGFVPGDLGFVPKGAVHYLAGQIGVDPEALADYGQRPKTRREHHLKAMEHLGIRRPSDRDFQRIQEWLTERALEHDRPVVLIEAACEKFKREHLVRAGITTVERMVARARSEAHEVSLRRLSPLLTKKCRAMLDGLLAPEAPGKRTMLGWLRRPATSNSPRALLDTLEKLQTLQNWGVPDWNLSAINPNRRKMLARLGRRYTNTELQRMAPERRYPILLAFLERTLTDVFDEAADIFDACMEGTHKRSKRALREHNQAIAGATQQKVRLFHRVGQLVLDPSIGDSKLRQEIFRRISPLELSAAVDEAEQIMRPKGMHYFDFLENRFSYVRQFAPTFLAVMPLKANQGGERVMEAVRVLREMNQANKRKVPADGPTRFVSRKWQPFVFPDGSAEVDRHGWELCLLSALRGRLRSGDVYLEDSRRHANPESYLISAGEWPTLKDEVCEQLGLTPSGTPTALPSEPAS